MSKPEKNTEATTPRHAFLAGCLITALAFSIGSYGGTFIKKSGNPPQGVAAQPLPEWEDRMHGEFLTETTNERSER